MMTITDPQFSSISEPSSRRHADVVESVDRVLPTLAHNADRSEAARTIPDESFAALLESNALQLFIPRRFGGPQVDYRTYIETTIKVSGACGASGWLCFILNHSDWQLGMMSASAQEAVWGNGLGSKIVVPLTPRPGFTARRVDGGAVVSGEWPYSSGSDRAKWALLGFPMTGEDGTPDMVTGLVSMDNVSEIKDTWHVTGLSGSSSNTVVVQETFIPDDWQLSMSEMLRREYKTPFFDETLYRMDVASVFHLATLAPVLGLAKAAFDLTLERITEKPRPLTYTSYTDATKAPMTQSAMARAGWLVDTAIEQARDIADEIDTKADLDEPVSPRVRARNAMRVAQGHRMCREAMDLILDVGGAGSFALSNPVQRMWRDMSIASRHGLSVPGLKEELYGRELLGAQEQQVTPLL